MNSNKFRILSLNSYHYIRGGSDVVYFNHNNIFKQMGWETAVFSMKHLNNVKSKWASYFVDEIEYGHYYPFLKKVYLATKVIYSLEAKRKLKKLIKKFQPSIAHAHCIHHHLSPSVLSLLHQRGIPTVLTAHELKLACPAYKMFNRHGICEKCKFGNVSFCIKNKCIHNSLALSSLITIETSVHKLLGLYKRNLDCVVAPSNFFRNKLIEWGWPSSKIVYIPNFINCKKYIPAFSPGDYFLYFGRLSPEKGLANLIKAALKSNVRLLIVGTGPDEIKLKEISQVNRSLIKFEGFCSGDKLMSFVKKCRAVVLPSEWYENAPMSILEAYAIGKPVIGSKIGGISELINEEKTGFFFKSGNCDDLSQLLKHVQTLSDIKITEIGKNARKYVSETFTEERYTNEILKLYNSIGDFSK